MSNVRQLFKQGTKSEPSEAERATYAHSRVLALAAVQRVRGGEEPGVVVFDEVEIICRGLDGDLRLAIVRLHAYIECLLEQANH